MFSFDHEFKCAIESSGILENTFETDMDTSGQMCILGLGESNWASFFEQYLKRPVPVPQRIAPAAGEATHFHMSDHEVIDLNGEAEMQAAARDHEMTVFTNKAETGFEALCCFCGKVEFSALHASLNMVKFKNCHHNHTVHGRCYLEAMTISGIKHKSTTCYVCLNWV